MSVYDKIKKEYIVVCTQCRQRFPKNSSAMPFSTYHNLAEFPELESKFLEMSSNFLFLASWILDLGSTFLE